MAYFGCKETISVAKTNLKAKAIEFVTMLSVIHVGIQDVQCVLFSLEVSNFLLVEAATFFKTKPQDCVKIFVYMSTQFIVLVASLVLLLKY